MGFPLVAKTERYLAPKTQKEHRRPPVSKPTVGQELLKQAGRKRLPCRFVRFAVWGASAETLVLLTHQPHRDFLCPLKTQRKVALSQADQQQGRSGSGDTLELEPQATRAIALAGVDFPLVLSKPVCTIA